MQNTTENIISDIFNREISFEYFESLYLLTCIPILIILILIYIRWQKKNLLRFSSKNLQKSLSGNKSIIRRNIKYILKILSISFLIIAMSKPRLLEDKKSKPEESVKQDNEEISSEEISSEEISSEGIEIMIALDISTSMLCEDVKPNRLSRSIKFVSDLVDNLNNHKIGLVIFAGKSYTEVPITTDYSFIKSVLRNISTDMIEVQGTNISNALQECVKGFDFNNSMKKCIIIISDGENHEEEALGTASKIVEETNIFMQTISVGREKGGVIPLLKKNRDKYYKKDREDRIIVTKPNIQFLSLLAKTGNGIHINLEGNNVTNLLLRQIDKIPQEEYIKRIRINKMKKKKTDSIEEEEDQHYQNLYTYFLLISFIIIFLDLVITSTNKRLLNKSVQK